MTRKEERIERAIQYANQAQVNSFNCGQGSLAGLLKEFKEDIGITDIEIDALLKANSKTWGLGGHGGTCGTVQGPIHFLGYVYGENQTDSPFNMVATMKMLNRVNVITEFTDRVLKERGSTNCRDFHIQLFQKYYDLNTPEGLAGYNKANAIEGCKKMAAFTVRTALDLILNDDGTLKKF